MWPTLMRFRSDLDAVALQKRVREQVVSFPSLAAWSIGRSASRSNKVSAEPPLYGSVTSDAVLLMAARSFSNPMRVVFRGKIRATPEGSTIDGRASRSLTLVLLLLVWIAFFVTEALDAIEKERGDLASIFALASMVLLIAFGVSYRWSQGDQETIAQSLRSATRGDDGKPIPICDTD